MAPMLVRVLCFSPSCKILSEHEVVPGRLLVVKDKLHSYYVIFVNIYANY